MNIIRVYVPYLAHLHPSQRRDLFDPHCYPLLVI